jgi:hypothetical protein
LLPTEEDGISAPSEVTPATSTSATSRCPKKPSLTIGATCDKCTSKYSSVPALILARVTESDW